MLKGRKYGSASLIYVGSLPRFEAVRSNDFASLTSSELRSPVDRSRIC